MKGGESLNIIGSRPHRNEDVIGRKVRVTVHRSGQTFDATLVPVELDV